VNLTGKAIRNGRPRRAFTKNAGAWKSATRPIGRRATFRNPASSAWTRNAGAAGGLDIKGIWDARIAGGRGESESEEAMSDVKQVTATMVEWFDDHWYKIVKDGQTNYYPSVTTKLGIVAKPFLAQWRGDIGNREADMRLFESQQRGTRIHAAWEVLTLGGLVVYNPIQRPLFIPEQIKEFQEQYDGLVEVVKYQDEMFQLVKLKTFLDVVKPKIVASETIVYSETFRDAGTVDNVMEIEEGVYAVNGREKLKLPKGLYIVDLKTGKTLDDNAYMQTAAYKNAWEEMGKGTIKGTLILHTGSTNKTGIPGLGVPYRDSRECQKDFEDFRNVSSLWERKNAETRPTTFEFPSLLTIKEMTNANSK